MNILNKYNDLPYPTLELNQTTMNTAWTTRNEYADFWIYYWRMKRMWFRHIYLNVILVYIKFIFYFILSILRDLTS